MPGQFSCFCYKSHKRKAGSRDRCQGCPVSAKLKTINGIKDGNGLITCTEGRQTASTQEVRLRKMVEFSRRLRHRLGISIPCFRGEDDIHTPIEEGRPPTASNEIGSVQTASVILLCNSKPNSSIREFMKTNAPIVDSILLRFLPLQDAINDSGVVTPEVTIETCPCNSCHCIVFWTLEELTIMLALRMPGTLKPLSNSLCLLPCLTCLGNGCHGCNSDSLLRVEGPLPLEQADEGHRVRVSESKVVSEILDDIGAGSINRKRHICICIPVHGGSSDVWTELLVRSLRSKDAEGRGVRVMASEAMEGYLGGRRGGSSECVKYNMVSFIMPRFTEVLINLLLSLWFGMDGFSSALVARRTIRDYIADSKGSAFAANAFLTEAVVKSDFNNAQVCQVLSFRGDLLGIKTLSFVACCVNLICSIVWVVHTVSRTHPNPNPTIIFTAVGIALLMDSFHILTLLTSIGHRLLQICCIISIPLTTYLTMFFDRHTYNYIQLALFGLASAWPSSNLKDKIFLLTLNLLPGLMTLASLFPLFSGYMALGSGIMLIFVCLVMLSLLFNPMGRIFICVIALEIAYLELLLPPMWGVGERDFARQYMRWVCGAVQTLVWVKWAGGSYILSKKNSLEFFGKSPHGWGLLLYSSAFFLNAVMAGIQSNWGEPWIKKSF